MNELDRMQAIIETQDYINDSDPSLSSVMRIVVERAQELTTATGAVVELAEGDEMVYAATSGSVSGTEGVRLSLHTSLSGLSVRTGDVLVSDDTETDDRVDREATRRVGARSMVVVPLQHHGATVGVLKVLSDQPHAFDSNDVTVLQALAGFIAAAVKRASVFDETHRLASTDQLTGLVNRAVFMDQLNRGLARSQRNGTGVGVVFIDLDGFKPINDTYGHKAGDQVLVEVAQRLSAVTRTADTVARLGGDEFAIVAENREGDTAEGLVERLVAAIDQPIDIGGQSVTVGASLGLATSEGPDSAESLLARADAAMYAIKRDKLLNRR